MASSFTPQQIEQFLQEFFDVVGARQYVGARYVPIFGRAGEDSVEWDDDAPYEPLTVVMHAGVSYVSRRYVPAGIQVTDTDYWAQTYRFNAQVEQYRQQVEALGREVDGVGDRVDTLDARLPVGAFQQTTVLEYVDNKNFETYTELADGFVPWPDGTTYPKYGTSGQVMQTLGDGTTKWEDPVVVTSDIAGPLIEDWLDDHPEATTTVQDGSITTAKLTDGAVTAAKLGSDVSTIVNGTNAGLKGVIRQYRDGADPTIVTREYEGYFDTSDVFQAGGGYHSIYTDPFPCAEGQVFRYRGKSEYAVAGWIFYDEGLVRIGQGQRNITGGYYDVTIPEGCYFVKFGSYAAVGTSITFEIVVPRTSPYYSRIDFNERLVRDNVPAIEVVRGYTLGGRGTISPESESIRGKITGLIPCEPGDVFHYRGYGAVALNSDVCYNENMEFIGSHQYSSNAAFTEITAPANCKFIRFGSYSTADDVILKVLTDYQYREVCTSNKLFDKKWTVCGDSFSESSWSDQDPEYYDYALGLYKTYSYYIGKRNDMKVVMKARSGQAMSDFMGVYQTIPTDSDYITIAYGLNDYSRGVPIGTDGDTAEDQTFKGYWNTALTWIITNCPSAKVGILIMPAYMGNSYRQAMEAMATKYGVSVYNLYTDPKTPMFMNKQGADATIAAQVYDHWRVAPGNNHPSRACHEFMSTFIEEWLRCM